MQRRARTTSGLTARGLIPTLSIIVLAAAACGSDPQSSSGETYEWDLPVYTGVSHHVTESLQGFADDVAERTDNQLQITVRPAGELPFTPDQILVKVGDGSVAMGDALSTFVSGTCHVSGLPFLPYLVQNYKEWVAAWPALQPYVEECFNPLGASVLFQYSWPSQNIWGKGDVPESLDDMGGLRLRTAATEAATVIESFGAEPVTLTTPEVADAAQRGLVDGVVTSAVTLPGEGWDEFFDWGYMVNMNVGPSFVLVNTDELEALPEEIREELEAAAESTGEQLLAEMEQLDADALEEMDGAGMTIVEASDQEIGRLTDFARENLWSQWASEGDAASVEALEEVRNSLDK